MVSILYPGRSLTRSVIVGSLTEAEGVGVGEGVRAGDIVDEDAGTGLIVVDGTVLLGTDDIGAGVALGFAHPAYIAVRATRQTPTNNILGNLANCMPPSGIYFTHCNTISYLTSIVRKG